MHPQFWILLRVSSASQPVARCKYTRFAGRLRFGFFNRPDDALVIELSRNPLSHRLYQLHRAAAAETSAPPLKPLNHHPMNARPTSSAAADHRPGTAHRRPSNRTPAPAKSASHQDMITKINQEKNFRLRLFRCRSAVLPSRIRRGWLTDEVDPFGEPAFVVSVSKSGLIWRVRVSNATTSGKAPSKP